MINSPILKVYEQIILNRLQKQLKTNKMLNEQQYGFVKNMSTNINLTQLFCKAKELKLAKKKPLLTFIDLKGAYDSVNYRVLF